MFRDSSFNLGVDEGLGTAAPQHLAASVFVANKGGNFTSKKQRFADDTTTDTLYYDADGSGTKYGKSVVASLTDHAALSAGGSGNLFFTS